MENKDYALKILEEFISNNNEALDFVLKDIDSFNEFIKSHEEKVLKIITNNRDLYNTLKSDNLDQIKNFLNDDNGKKQVIKIIEAYLESEMGKNKIVLVVKGYTDKQIKKFATYIVLGVGSFLSFVFYKIIEFKLAELLDKP